MLISSLLALAAGVHRDPPVMLDLAADESRRVIVDREDGVYLGHVSTVLLEDGKTILAFYPKGHGGGEILMKKSVDGGRTWGDRLATPVSWKTSRECPSIHRLTDEKGHRRLILWSGLFPARFAVSEDDGEHWSELRDAAEGLPASERWGGIVVMSSMEAGKEPGHYLAWFHDDGRYFADKGKRTDTFTVYQVETLDGGQHWGFPREISRSDQVWLCEPGTVRSPDGGTIAMLLREESRRKRSHLMATRDEGRTWTEPVEAPAALCGDKHTARLTPDGRLVVSFREHTVRGSITGDQDPSTVAGASPWEGDWVLWVGTFEDLEKGREGQYKVRLMDNQKAWDCAYPGLEVLADGTIVATTYGHWEKGRDPYIVSVRLTLAELDAMARR